MTSQPSSILLPEFVDGFLHTLPTNVPSQALVATLFQKWLKVAAAKSPTGVKDSI